MEAGQKVRSKKVIMAKGGVTVLLPKGAEGVVKGIIDDNYTQIDYGNGTLVIQAPASFELIDLPTEVKNEIPEIKDAIDFTTALIRFDPTPYKELAELEVKKYMGLEFTEEDIKSVNKIIADLNKRIKDFESVRMDIKRTYNIPMTEFEAKIHSVNNVYSNVILQLKSKVAVYEEKYRKAKENTITELILECTKSFNLNDKYSANITIIDKYLNKTESISKIKKDIQLRCEQQFTYQENERLAEEAKNERLQRRINLLQELNANYTSKIEREVTYVETAQLNDDEVCKVFEDRSFKYCERIERERLAKLEEKVINSTIPPIVKALDPEYITFNPENSPLGLQPTPEELIFGTQDVQKNVVAIDLTPEPLTKPHPNPTGQVKHRYVCDISTTATEDTILPWLKKMKEHGIITFVIRKCDE